jgi:hypothetical protein
MSLSSAGILTVADDIIIGDGKTIGSASDPDAITIASGGGVTFTQTPVFPDGSLALVDLDIDGGTDIGAAIVDADLFIVDDGAGGTNRKTTASRLKTYIGGGITMADQWRVTTGFTDSAAPIASNWERNDTTPALSYFGSQMTESSGVFTFPSTGIYYVSFHANFKINGDSRYNYTLIKGTTDGSTLITLTEAATFIQQTQSATTYASSNSEVMVDVTNTSNIKVAFEINVANSSTETLCNTARDVTFARFIRLGDT